MISKTASKLLAQTFKRKNRLRNRWLLLVITLVMILGFVILSLANGKIQADILRNEYLDGNTASTYLENGTKQNVRQLAMLPYVNKTGLENNAGKLMAINYYDYATCAVLDDVAYNEMIKPTFLHVYGKYPQAANEIMLSVKTLNYLGISKPQVGMTVTLDFAWSGVYTLRTELTGMQPFVLSGYYQDFDDELSDASTAYISKARLEQAAIPMYPARIFIETDTPYLSGEQMEKTFNKDIKLGDRQQFICLDSAAYRAVGAVAGSYLIAALLLLVILLSMFLFVYNVLHISMERDIRQYGLLETVGVSKKQIKKVVYFEMAKLWLAGCAVGGISGIMAAVFLLPGMIQNLYLGGLGILPPLKLYDWKLTVLLFVFVGIVLFAAFHRSLRRLVKLGPLEALKYGETNQAVHSQAQKEKNSWRKDVRKKAGVLRKMAYHNILRSKKKFLFTVFSLSLGLEVALSASVIAAGTNQMHRLQKNPDFTVELTQKACVYLMEHSHTTYKRKFFSTDFLTKIETMNGIKTDTMTDVKGFIPILGKEGENITILDEDALPIIQRLASKEVTKLMQYVEKKNLLVDKKTFLHGNGTLLLYHNALQQDVPALAKEKIGQPIYAKDLVPVFTDTSRLKPQQLTNCGYVKAAGKEFPELNLAWNGVNTTYLLISADLANRLSQHMTEQTFRISFGIEETKEPISKETLKQWIRRENMKFQSETGVAGLNLYALTCNSDVIAKETAYIKASQMIMYTISASLVLIGIMNYLTTMITEIFSRKQEFALMQSVGMTKKQVRWMLMLKSLYDCCGIIGIHLTLGSGVLFVLQACMKGQLDYFVFQYPGGMLLLIILVMALICLLVPALLFRFINTRSAAENLKMNT